MNFREMNLAVFRREALPHVLFQPRFEPWVAWHKLFDTLPDEIVGMDMLQVYDHVGCSMRYVDYYTDAPRPVDDGYSDEVQVDVEQVERDGVRFKHLHFHTPHGTLRQIEEFTVDHTWRTVEFMAKSVDDLLALRWLIEHRTLRFNPDNFAIGDTYVGERGVPQFYLPKSPYFALAQQYMSYPDLVYALVDDPGAVEATMDLIDQSYDGLYEQLVESDVRILNLGENVAEAFASPQWFERYCIPWYRKRMGQLRDAGIFTHIHIDGYFTTLLDYLADLPFDGLEALTPLPQGDASLEQIERYTGDKVLLDVIPAVLFLRHHPREQLERCVEQIVQRFGPRLILGISDELPQGGDDESFDRLKWVAEYAKSTTPATPSR